MFRCVATVTMERWLAVGCKPVFIYLVYIAFRGVKASNVRYWSINVFLIKRVKPLRVNRQASNNTKHACTHKHKTFQFALKKKVPWHSIFNSLVPFTFFFCSSWVSPWVSSMVDWEHVLYTRSMSNSPVLSTSPAMNPTKKLTEALNKK